MALETVEEGWNSYAEAIFQGMSPTRTQIVETKKAFYAGALFLLQQSTIIGTDAVSEDEGVEYLEGINDELHAFVKLTLKEYLERN